MINSGGGKEGFTPDRIIHEPTRLQIISYLAAGGKQVSFTELKEKLGLTAGNLSIQLKRLEEAGYVAITKSIRERKPLTRVSLTRQGFEALQQYLRELEEMIELLKKSATPQASAKEEETN
ncbi:MAG: transcriptional regulator [Bacillota bacterium]